MAVWEAREATVIIGTAVGTVQGSATLLSQVSTTDYTSRITDVSISGAERDVESIPTLGENASGYANQEIFQKSVGTLRECSMTLVYQDVDITVLGSGTVATSGAASGYTRIQGDQDLSQVAVLISFNSGSSYANILLNNAFVTKLGDYKISADGHLTQEITFKCLAKDYYEETNA